MADSEPSTWSIVSLLSASWDQLGFVLTLTRHCHAPFRNAFLHTQPISGLEDHMPSWWTFSRVYLYRLLPCILYLCIGKGALVDLADLV